MTNPDIIIIGGGLSGLALARKLEAQNRNYLLLEGRDRFGGRIYSSQGFDLGPAWFWPGQPRIKALVEALGLGFFAQQETGKSLFQTAAGIETINQPLAGMCYRVEGGLGAVTHGLLASIPEHKRQLNTAVKGVTQTDEGIEVSAEHGGQSITLTTGKVVLAAPPRVIVENIAFAPPLPAVMVQELENTPTWMAGHAKAVIKFPSPFWRNLGYSGSAFSQRGPLMQIHDASQDNADRYALFGFFGLSADHRKAYGEAQLINLIAQQMQDLFGDEAKNHLGVEIYDWALESLTTAVKDQTPLTHHPRYGLSQTTAWNDNIIVGVTESARQYGGFLEGALEAAEMSLASINTSQTQVA